MPKSAPNRKPLGPEVVYMDVEQLEPDPDNIRTIYDQSLVAGLAEFLKNEGKFIEDPVVWQAGTMSDGRPRYRAFSGSTRVQAARMVGGKLSVVVMPEPPEGSAKLLGQLSTGLLKGNLNP